MNSVKVTREEVKRFLFVQNSNYGFDYESSKGSSDGYGDGYGVGSGDSEGYGGDIIKLIKKEYKNINK